MAAKRRPSCVPWKVKMLRPGTLLNLRDSPESGLWTVVSCENVPERFKASMEAVLLNKGTLMSVWASSRQAFLERWEIVHEP